MIVNCMAFTLTDESPESCQNGAMFPPRLMLALTLSVFLTGRYSMEAASPHSHLSRCRGDTHTHVHIHWPSSEDLQIDRHLTWAGHLPERIRRWGYLIQQDSITVGVDPLLVAAVMRVESNGDPLIWNLDSDARGLMQVLHAPFEPAINVRLGV